MTPPPQASSSQPEDNAHTNPAPPSAASTSAPRTPIASMTYTAIAHRLRVLEQQYHEYHARFHACQRKIFEVARHPILSAFGPSHYLEVSYEVAGLGVRSFICAKGDMEAEKARMSAAMRRVLAEHRELEIRRRGMVQDVGTYR